MSADGLIIGGQIPVLITTAITFGLTFILAAYLSKAYAKKRTANYLMWSLGLWVFVIGVLLEMVFALNIYTTALIDMYLFLVVILVELLALGSVSSVKSALVKKAYYAYTIIVTIFAAYTVIAQNPGNLMVNYVVAGNPPLMVIISSSLATFPAAIALIVLALRGYFKTKNRKLLSIVVGVIVVSIAGTLYIVQFPAFLYIAEFAGIVLLWFGFFTFGK